MKKQNTAQRRTVTVRRGEYGLDDVSAAARAVGRSKAWVSLVLNGRRKSKRLMARLQKAGVRLACGMKRIGLEVKVA